MNTIILITRRERIKTTEKESEDEGNENKKMRKKNCVKDKNQGCIKRYYQQNSGEIIL